MKKITEIRENKKNENRVSIFSDDVFIMACDKELIYKHHIKKGDPLDEERLKEIIADDDFIKAREIGLRQLERSFKTEKQIKDKLLEKEFSEETIEQVMEKLREYNLVDDYKYAELFLKEKLRTRGLRKASFELSRKGVPKEIIDEVSRDMDTEPIEENSCLVHGKKKYNLLIKRETDVYKIKNKLFTYLASKGYDFDLIKASLDEIMGEEE